MSTPFPVGFGPSFSHSDEQAPKQKDCTERGIVQDSLTTLSLENDTDFTVINKSTKPFNKGHVLAAAASKNEEKHVIGPLKVPNLVTKGYSALSFTTGLPVQDEERMDCSDPPQIQEPRKMPALGEERMDCSDPPHIQEPRATPALGEERMDCNDPPHIQEPRKMPAVGEERMDCSDPPQIQEPRKMPAVVEERMDCSDPPQIQEPRKMPALGEKHMDCNDSPQIQEPRETSALGEERMDCNDNPTIPNQLTIQTDEGNMVEIMMRSHWTEQKYDVASTSSLVTRKRQRKRPYPRKDKVKEILEIGPLNRAKSEKWLALVELVKDPPDVRPTMSVPLPASREPDLMTSAEETEDGMD